LSGKKELHEQRADRRAIPQGQDGRHRILLLRYTGQFIVVGKFRSGFVTDIECYEELLPARYHAGRDRLGGKSVIQKRGEHENRQPSHTDTILKKESTVNAKVGLVETHEQESLRNVRRRAAAYGRRCVRRSALPRASRKKKDREASACLPGNGLFCDRIIF